VQEAHDLACVTHAATLETRVPFLHFFDGFRTSHEERKIALLDDDDLLAMIPDELVDAHRRRALTPDRPVLRGSAANPDDKGGERSLGARRLNESLSSDHAPAIRRSGVPRTMSAVRWHRRGSPSGSPSCPPPTPQP
jgi:pyruvate/2-oxoacid:ferredoxin oxidoreductase alpha subunit